ncbi:hypothetical protein [Mesorhizobium sp. M7A.F.Ca.MR.362.00.0.0]|uniref:hypothetical protein n=1 Tax=Mesorhizobium sp. M7A.F.Ca.MR.362.00.0.0 TaxID=2496779 RepID=UPI000FD2FE73|nr:hypothetical protein [Mesorhizobium sp. M7A.F.Ca.MR.362.00.0.0]RUU82742.1 hypothetical protein EOC06_02825 [Mesorhizobium sp. M7A.F.Ca.MR.362.00.0.0]RWN96569.1 MAG: hypothetical protein EOS05_01090 [Mesorhizobium sp.]
MKFFRYVSAVLAIAISASAGWADDQDPIYYGSRAGMQLTTVSTEGIGTANAKIHVRHTPKDAKAFCVQYNSDYSMACVKQTMALVKIDDYVTGNCVKRTWLDLSNEKFAFLGRAKKSDEMIADYAIKRVKTGEILDGTTASGYWVELGIFQHLCPGIAK